MKRAPGAASTLRRLRRAGSAQLRRSSSATPARRAETSARFRATIPARIPPDSVIGRLDERFEAAMGGAAADRVERHGGSLAKRGGKARNHQQRAGVER